MNKFKIPYDENLHFSKKDLSYIQLDEGLKPFYKYPPDLDSVEKVISDKTREYSRERREVLVSDLRKQYLDMPKDSAAEEQLDLLEQDRTFTVCTAHQPCLLTGPLYVIYKICSTLRLAGELKQKYPNFNFVPVFISGGEDHDLEEINHFYLYGKKIEWDTSQEGSVGRMSLEGIDEIIGQVKEFAGNSNYAAEAVDLLLAAKSGTNNYGAFFRRLISLIFKESGLLILNMDRFHLKKSASEIFREDLVDQTSKKLVTQTQEELQDLGFSMQAYARKINLFYFHEGQRLRIEKINDQYQLVDTSIVFSESELLNILEKHPDRFSPNVVLRPLYQEYILPNLAYVGGGGELAYWIERNSQFEHFGINFPMLIRRNSVFWIDHIGTKNLKQLELNGPEIFKGLDHVINDYVLEEAEEEISLSEEKNELNDLFERIEKKAAKLDQSILKTIRAEEVKHLKSIDHLEHKLLKAKKQQLEIKINKIKKVHEKLFPMNKPQERVDNFLMYYFRMGPEWISLLTNSLNPMDKEVLVFQEEG
nr:bacillithiol biosynthesis cysteine-adding enzyme BshC [Saprospiraceae bacterium]